MTTSDLGWLVAKGIVQHARETSEYGDPRRAFQSRVGLKFTTETYFVLAPTGDEFIDRRLIDD
jgi:hypothetical protein